jgi:iron(III) transport system permease protein
MILEWPGRWRLGSVAALLALPMLPTLPLLWFSLGSTHQFSLGGAAFEHALANSLIVALLVMLGSFALGLPIGVLNALYDYRRRKLLLTLSMLPLLSPPFLWVIGWRGFLQYYCRAWLPHVSGYLGCLLAFLPGAVTLVLFVTHASTAALSASQVEAARLAGGERTLFRLACRHASVPALLAAMLAGILTLSDPGAGFTVGVPMASSAVLTSFAAFYDYALAGRQCLILALIVLAIALPIAYLAAPRLAAELSARQFRPVQRMRHPGMSKTAGVTLFVLVLMLTLLPSSGLVLPLRDDFQQSSHSPVGYGKSQPPGNNQPRSYWIDLKRACGDLRHTGLNTLLYAAGAGAFATGLGLALAFCAGREERLRRLAIGVCLALFALPPMLSALGFVRGASWMPAWTDPVLRGRLGVCLALGMRFFPVAAMLALRGWGTMSPSLARAAGVHGVPLGRYLWRVVLPLQRRAIATGMMLVGLLATAEIGMVLLLYPPGEESFPLHIFQIIGYPSPSSRLAALCLVDLAVAIGLLAVTWRLGEGDRA